MSSEEGTSTGFHVGPVYFEHTSTGDYNVGVAFGPSGGEGVVGGTQVYAEVTYNSNDGFSAGYGVNAEAGVGVNLGPGVKDLSGGVYSTAYISKDSRE